MPIYGQRPGKPELGAMIDRSRPLSKGLVFFAPLSEGAGLSAYDAASSNTLSLPITAATWGSGLMGGLSCTSSTQGAQVTTPANLKLTGPMSIAVAFRLLSSPSGSNRQFFGASFASTNTTPFNAVILGYRNVSSSLTMLVGTGNVSSSITPTVGADYVSSATISGTTGTLYVNGVQAASGAVSAPSYSASSILAIGANTAFGVNPGILVYWAALWSRSLAATEHAAIGAAPSAIFGRVFMPQAYRLFGVTANFRTRRTLYDRAGSRGVA